MKTLLNVLKVNELKAVAGVTGVTVTAKTLKKDLVNDLSVYFTGEEAIANHKINNRQFIIFGTQNIEAEDFTTIANSMILPIGGFHVSPINIDNKGFINAEHYDLLASDELTKADDSVVFDITAGARVFVVNNELDYKILFAICGEHTTEISVAFEKAMTETGSTIHTTKFLNYEKATQYLDMILFTQNAVEEMALSTTGYDLYALDYERAIILNPTIITNDQYVDNVDLNGELLTSVLDVKKAYNDSTKKTREQVKIRKVNIDDFRFDQCGLPIIPRNMKLVEASMSSNRLFRAYSNERTVEVEGLLVTEKVANNFLIVDMVSLSKDKNTDVMLRALICNGFLDLTDDTITGEAFNGDLTNRKHMVSLQSASQSRQGKFIFTSVDRDEMRSNMVYGHNFGDKVSISKMEARITLCLSSATGVGYDYTYAVIDDAVCPSERDVVIYNGETPEIHTVNLPLTPTDGMGTIEVLPSAKVARELNLISQREYNFFVKNYTNIKDIRDNAKLMTIFNKIPNAFQIRHAGDKGLLVMFPHSEYGYSEDIVLNKSMHKYSVESGEVTELEIANWNKPKEERVFMNYQFLQALDIAAESLIGLTQKALDVVTEEVMVDAVKAMKFLGMVIGIGTDSDIADKVLVNKIALILSEDHTMINDKKVQSGLYDLLQKYVSELAIGKVPVKGAFRYLCVDPRFMFMTEEEYKTSADTLKAGQNYSSNKTGLFAGFRSPLIHSSEVCRLNMIANESLWFMKDLIVLNPFDDTLPRAAGADVDGDIMLETDEEVIVDSIPKFMPMNYNEGRNGIERANNWDSREMHFLNTATRDRVGQITNLATVYRDLSLHNNDPYLFNANVITLAFMQGWEIDKAKTGFNFDLPESLKTNYVPHWVAGVKDKDGNIKFKGVKQLKGRDVSNKAEVYVSKSPMGKLFDFVNAFVVELKSKIKVQHEDKTLKFIKHVDNAEFSRIMPAVKVLENHYRIDIANIGNLQQNGLTEEEIDALYEDVYSKYKSLLSTVSSDEMAIAAAVYHVAYNRPNHESESYSMPWICAFNGMLQLIHANGNATRMVRLPSFNSDIVDSVTVNNSGMLFINEAPYKMTTYPAGVYEVIAMDNVKYILVPKECVYQAEESTNVRFTETPLYQFSICGFKHYGFTGLEVLDMIKANDGQFALVNIEDKAKLFVNDKMIGSFNNKESVLLGELINKQFKLVDNQEVLYVPKRATGTTTMHTDGIHAILNSYFVTAVPLCSVNPTDAVYAPVVTADDEFAQAIDDGSIDYSYEESYNDYASYEMEQSYSITEAVVIEPVVTITNTVESFDVLDEAIVAKLANQSYWNVKSLAKPANVDKFEVAIVNTKLTAGCTVGTVAVFNKGVEYKFEVVVSEDCSGLKLVSAFTPKSQEFINWILRLVTYKFYKVQ